MDRLPFQLFNIVNLGGLNGLYDIFPTNGGPRNPEWVTLVETLRDTFRNNGIMASLIATAAAALLVASTQEASRILLLSSVAFSLFSARFSHSLLSPTSILSNLPNKWDTSPKSKQDVIIIVLYLPEALLFYATTLFKIALLVEAWRGDNVATKIVLTCIIVLLFFVFFFVRYLLRRSGMCKILESFPRPKMLIKMHLNQART